MGFGKLGPIQGHAAVATCQPSGSGHDNFIGIRANGCNFFLDSFTVSFFFFSSPVDIGSVLTILVTNVYLKCY